MSGTRIPHFLVHGGTVACGATAAVLIALSVFVGSIRGPADPTAPLEIVGDVARPVDPAAPLRFATFNMNSGKGQDGRVDLARTAEALREIDFAALQEVRGDWRHADDQAAQLGKELGLRSVFVAGERRWWHPRFGTGQISRLPIEAVHRIPLPNTLGKRYRVATITEVEHRGKTVRVLAAHIARGTDHASQLRSVCRLFLSLEEPAVLLGDLNSCADVPELAAVLSHPSTTALVHVGLDKGIDIRKQPEKSGFDWIIARGLHCVHREIRDLGVSDHPAVFAELDFLPNRTERIARSDSHRDRGKPTEADRSSRAGN